jgi:hypothetical protein
MNSQLAAERSVARRSARYLFSADVSGFSITLFGSGGSVHTAERTEEPENEQDHEYDAQHAAEPSPAVAPVAVVASAAAKQNDQQNDDQDCRHSISPFIVASIIFVRAAAGIIPG